ncbi:MAG TPA: tetratricopeptide repeat protein [Pseudolabrys sp.]|jgi:Flp pilus assembly protein TadD|nr:tetratricopeptide repeat protein [Pseudolabrys sp.]
MRGVAQVVVMLLLGVWLAGCGTTTTTTTVAGDLSNSGAAVEQTAEQPAARDTARDTIDQTMLASAVPPTAPEAAMPPPGSQAGLLGSNPEDDLSLGKKYYRNGSYGLAEKYFRRAVETHPSDAESWLGLAAAYDRLRRFDFADRAYGQAIRIAGPTVEIINNQGYSLMLRGKYREAAAKFAQAATKAPENVYVKNNIRLLAEATHQRKSIE